MEQYTIPGNLAAEILNLAYMRGDIEDRIVLELGCGSGRLAIGSCVLGAEYTIGVDRDEESLRLAKGNLGKIRKMVPEPAIDFVWADVGAWSCRCDTAIQNPPFGIQKLHADRLFLRKALECAPKVYSLHMGGKESTRRFLVGFIESLGAHVDEIASYEFTTPHLFDFHEKAKTSYQVDLYMISKVHV